MNKSRICELLKFFREEDIICYAYRETVFNILSTGKCDGTLYLITDVSANVMIDALTQRGFTDITRGGENIDAKLGQQNVKVRVVDGDTDKLSKTISQPLTVCSMLLRDDGDIYDEFGGQKDIEEKILRKTGVPIKDKNAFCSFCFDLTLKRGYVPDAAVKDEMKKMVTLQLPKKIQLMMSVRNYLKSPHFNMEYILNTLSYDGLFTSAGAVSKAKRSDLDSLVRKADQANITLLLCYLVGIKGEQLKSITNFDMRKESYEKICRFIKDGETVDMLAIRNRFSDAEVNGLLFVAEFIALLAGNDFVVKEARSNLFRTFDKSDFWKKVLGAEMKSEPVKPKQEALDQTVENTEQDAVGEPEDMFGGVEEEGYEVEDSDEEWPGHVADNSGLNLRNSGENHYIKK